MCRVATVKALDGYCLQIEFTDGVTGTLDVSDRLFGPVFEPLKDPRLFAQVRVDPFGAICWPNGADLAPDAVHETLAGRHVDA
ncbi:MAG: DUF2442 domain-containing protein [Pirellulaceae bacterium]